MSLKNKIKIIPRHLIVDDRGWFLKVVTGIEDRIPNHTGEVYLTMGKPGQIKGAHYHHLAIEWFTVISGEGTLKLEDIKTHEQLSIHLKFEDAKTIFVPNNVAHEWINDSDDNIIVLAYTDRLYDPTDTISYKF